MRFGLFVLIGVDWLICRDGLVNAIVSLKMKALIPMTPWNQMVTGCRVVNASNLNGNHA